MLFDKHRSATSLLVAFLMISATFTYAQSGRLARANAAYDELSYTPAIELYKSLLENTESYSVLPLSTSAVSVVKIQLNTIGVAPNFCHSHLTASASFSKLGNFAVSIHWT